MYYSVLQIFSYVGITKHPFGATFFAQIFQKVTIEIQESIPFIKNVYYNCTFSFFRNYIFNVSNHFPKFASTPKKHSWLETFSIRDEKWWGDDTMYCDISSFIRLPTHH